MFSNLFDLRMYILFVLTFYAFSIAVLMVKYIKREREGSKLEFYYNEFVKRDWYKDKNLYDNRGRRIHYNEDGSKVIILPFFIIFYFFSENMVAV
jgi:hypothetical protein